MPDTSKLVRMRVTNFGCFGPEGCEIALDNILCLVGANNTGKSTLLRAYELAVGNMKFEPKTDVCQRAEGPAAIEIWVHIPEGMPNISEEWKEIDGDLRLVRSKWEWSEEGDWKKTRSTWNPREGAYAADGKASGLDTVFNSRLPIPFRIGSLESPDAEHKRLLTLILQPLQQKINSLKADKSSELSKAIALVANLASKPVHEERERIKELAADINKIHNSIFPDLALDLDIGLGELDVDPASELLNNSKVNVLDGPDKVSWSQQGSGSQRALFWTMLQVRSRLKTLTGIVDGKRKAVADIEKQIKKLQKEAESNKKEETKKKKLSEILELEERVAALNSEEGAAGDQADDLLLPGYMLIIDEPEVALHPRAIRAASRYLFALAQDRSWQIMLSTHSPLFIDPLQDHTTIVRLTRDGANPTPQIFQSDRCNFATDEKETLKVLNRFDQGVAEMFFGARPILIEGDTEFACFEYLMNAEGADFPINDRPLLLRAHGKSTLLLIIKILAQFKVDFAILHDTDSPYRTDGAANGSWTTNTDILNALKALRDDGLKIVHRVSIPAFEQAYFPTRGQDGSLMPVSDKDKPWKALQIIRTNDAARQSISDLLSDLINPGAQPAVESCIDEPALRATVMAWAALNAPLDRRFGVLATESNEPQIP